MTQAMIAAAVDAKALAQPLTPGADGSLEELDAAAGASTLRYQCSGCTLVTVWARTQLGFLTPQSNHQSQQQSEHNAQQ